MRSENILKFYIGEFCIASKLLSDDFKPNFREQLVYITDVKHTAIGTYYEYAYDDFDKRLINCYRLRKLTNNEKLLVENKKWQELPHEF